MASAEGCQEPSNDPIAVQRREVVGRQAEALAENHRVVLAKAWRAIAQLPWRAAKQTDADQRSPTRRNFSETSLITVCGNRPKGRSSRRRSIARD